MKKFLRVIIIVLAGIVGLFISLNVFFWGYGLITSLMPSPVRTAPHLSNTYQFVRLANVIGVDLGRHWEKTIAWINNSACSDGTFTMEHANSPVDREDTLGTIYYATLALKELGVSSLPYPDATIQHVQSLQMPNGAFSQIPGETNTYWVEKGIPEVNIENLDLSNTYRALFILDYLGAEPSDLDACREWLLRYWPTLKRQRPGKHQGEPLVVEQIPDLIKSLQLLNVEVEELAGYESVVAQAQQWQNAIARQMPLSPDSIHEGYSIQELSKLLHLESPQLSALFVPQLLQHQHDDGGFDFWLGPYSESLGTRMAVEIIVNAGEPVPKREKLEELIRKHMSRYGGFYLISHQRPKQEKRSD